MTTERIMTQVNMVGLRGGVGLLLEAKMATQRMAVVVGDTLTSAGLQRAFKRYPENFVECGIAEQTMILAAGAIALEKIPTVCTTFAPFLSMRGCEQIRLMTGYMRAPVFYLGFGAGFSLGYLGATHCAVEDIAIFGVVAPDVDLLTPFDAISLNYCVERYFQSPKPTYCRLAGEGPLNHPAPTFRCDDYASWRFSGEAEQDCRAIVFASGKVLLDLLNYVHQRSDCSGFYVVALVRNTPEIVRSVLVAEAHENSNIFVADDHLRSSGISRVVEKGCKLDGRFTRVLDIGSFENIGQIGPAHAMAEDVGLDPVSIINVLKIENG